MSGVSRVLTCVLALVVASCSDAERLKDAIRVEAAMKYGAECGAMSIPDESLFPVEITGDASPELAVSFARVKCGDSLSRWTGTGGVVVQFWTLRDGEPRMLLEQQMHGFTPAGDRLITMQHGGFCPGGAGPDQCRVLYQWNSRDQRLDVVSRELASTLGNVEPMAFDCDKLRQ